MEYLLRGVSRGREMALARKRNWIGIDEVGRGPLAGPVVAGAVLLPEGVKIRGIRDSKTIPRTEREELSEIIKEKCFYALGVASVEEIDRLNILRASLLAMQRAFLGLLEKYEWMREDDFFLDSHLVRGGGVFNSCSKKATHKDEVRVHHFDPSVLTRGKGKLGKVQGVLVDGKYVFPLPDDLEFACRAVVAGDAKIVPIAAASIIAKTYRDEMMRELSSEYNVYGFERNYGYATREHLEALEHYGACSVHRKSFVRVREVIYQKCLKFEN